MLKGLIYKFLSLQELFLRKRLAKTLGVKNTSKKKEHFYKGCTVSLSTLAEKEKQRLEEEINLILNKYNYEPEKILKYIESQNTKVIFLDNASKLLAPITENEGFIYPAKGAKALYLALAAEKTFKLQTDAMFILSKGKINKYFFIYQFYNWFAYKNNIAGLDTESQELLKKYLYSDSPVETLQLSDIYKLKDAIHQDKAAIEFVIKLCRNFEGTSQALNKIKQEGSAIL